MTHTAMIYLELWVSCLLVCMGMTLVLVLMFSEAVNAQTRSLLLRVSCVAGVLFLVCSGQWIFAVCFVPLMWTASFQRWLSDGSDKPLREACGWLLFGGVLGLVDVLGWFPVMLRPLGHPGISIGLVLGILGSVAWGVFVSLQNDRLKNKD